MNYDDDPLFVYRIRNQKSLIQAVSIIVWKLKERHTIPPDYNNVSDIIKNLVLKYRKELYDDDEFHHILFLLKEDFLFRDFLLSKKKCCLLR